MLTSSYHPSRFGWPGRGTLLLGVASLLSACAELPTLNERSEVALHVEGLSMNPLLFQQTGALQITVSGQPEDAAGAAAAVPVVVYTDRGERETLLLLPLWEHTAGSLIVTMQEGSHVAELRPRLESVSARYTSLGFFGEWAALQIFEMNVHAAIQRIRRWPGVKSVERNQLVRFDGFDGIGDGTPRGDSFVGALPLEEGEVRAGDGRVQARLGDLLTVEYRHPDGTLYSRSLRLQVPDQPEVPRFLPLLVEAIEAALYDPATPQSARPPLLIDAESFAVAAWQASGSTLAPAAVVADLQREHRLVGRQEAERCRLSVAPRDCSALAEGTFLYVSSIYRTPFSYEVVAAYRPPDAPAACLRQSAFNLAFTEGRWLLQDQLHLFGC